MNDPTSLSPDMLSSLFDAKFLFASLIWGTVGFAYFIYGKKQSSLMPMIGGVLIMAGSYFISSALGMSLITIVIIVAIHVMMRRGY